MNNLGVVEMNWFSMFGWIGLKLCVFAGLISCEPSPGEVPQPRLDVPVTKTTSSRIAIRNINRELESIRQQLQVQSQPHLQERLVSLLLFRFHTLGYIENLDEAVEISQTASAQTKKRVALARHHFQDILDASAMHRCVDDQKKISSSPISTSAQLDQAVAWLAIGDPNAARQCLQNIPDSFRRRVLNAAVLAALGQFDEADRELVLALTEYRDVSPFPVADLYFRRGVMWAEQAGMPERGIQMYRAGLAVLPEHVTMSIHLAELLWEKESAEAGLKQLSSIPSDVTNPEVAALRSELLLEIGREIESNQALNQAKAQYSSLLSKHPEAYWDHGSEFYAGPGANPDLAVELARRNLNVRNTERAAQVLLSAAQSAGYQSLACQVTKKWKALDLYRVPFKEHIESNLVTCP